MSCDPALAARFTPRRPLLGRYEVCTDPRPLEDVAPAGWAVLALDPVDAFGAAGSYDRTALPAALRRRPRPRRPRLDGHGGSIRVADLHLTVPNAALTALEPGTLVIRWICERGQAQCKMTNAR